MFYLQISHSGLDTRSILYGKYIVHMDVCDSCSNQEQIVEPSIVILI